MAPVVRRPPSRTDHFDLSGARAAARCPSSHFTRRVQYRRACTRPPRDRVRDRDRVRVRVRLTVLQSRDRLSTWGAGAIAHLRGGGWGGGPIISRWRRGRGRRCTARARILPTFCPVGLRSRRLSARMQRDRPSRKTFWDPDTPRVQTRRAQEGGRKRGRVPSASCGRHGGARRHPHLRARGFRGSRP